MRIWISKTTFTSLAALTLSLATLGAVAPSYADGGNGSELSAPFPPDGIVRLGLGAPADQSYSAYYPSDAGSRADSALTRPDRRPIDYRSNSHSSGTK